MAGKETKFDSLQHLEDRRAKIKEESDQIEKVQAERVKRQAEDQEVAQYKGPIGPDDTRETILDRIRKMREQPEETVMTRHITEFQAAQIKLEQEAGRAAVKKAEEEAERNRNLREQAAEEQRKREGEMSTVVHPNPSQRDVFPANKATLK